MKNKKQTSASVASLAAKTLSLPNASKRIKSLAGSALAQAGKPRRRTAAAAKA